MNETTEKEKVKRRTLRKRVKMERTPVPTSLIKRSKILKNLKDFEKETNFSIYLGTGLYEIIVGLFLALLVSFLIGLPIIMAYPFISPVLLWGIKIFGYLLIAFGIITSISPFLMPRIAENSTPERILKTLLKISTIITFILIPIGIFLGLALKSEISTEKGTERKESSIARYYFLLLFIAGFIHLVIGALLVFVVPSLLEGVADLAFPYITSETMNFLTILGWICLIPGLALLICSFWSKKLGNVESIETLELKVITTIIIIASVFLVLVFPIGTFFGLTLIQEFNALKHKKKLAKSPLKL